MTQDEFNAALEGGKISSVDAPQTSDASSSKSDNAASTPAAPALPATISSATNTDLTQFIPMLVALQSMQRYTSVAPTFVPQTFQDQIQYVFDGTNYYAYFYFNNQWKSVQLGLTGLSQTRGTDGTTTNSHSTTVTHTITHALGKKPSIILVSATLNPTGVAGSNTNLGQGGGTIMLDGDGNTIGGVAAAFMTGAPAGAMGFVDLTGGPGSITAQTITSGGTAHMTVSVNNVTPSTFDILYTVSDNGGFGAPTQNFSVTWTVIG